MVAGSCSEEGAETRMFPARSVVRFSDATTSPRTQTAAPGATGTPGPRTDSALPASASHGRPSFAGSHAHTPTNARPTSPGVQPRTLITLPPPQCRPEG